MSLDFKISYNQLCRYWKVTWNGQWTASIIESCGEFILIRHWRKGMQEIGRRAIVEEAKAYFTEKVDAKSGTNGATQGL